MEQVNITYIKMYYLTVDEIAHRTGKDVQAILKLIEEKLLPAPSYTITQRTVISSPLGDRLASEAQVDYYPASIVEFLLREPGPGTEKDLQDTFRASFRKSLESHPDKEYAYGNIFNEEGKLLEAEFEKAFESEWRAYQQGIYGICTKKATEEAIVKKEVAVRKLIEFNSKYGSSPLNKTERELLVRLKEEYDSVSSLFAPYQRESSSRGKYLDQILTQNGLAHLVDQY